MKNYSREDVINNKFTIARCTVSCIVLELHLKMPVCISTKNPYTGQFNEPYTDADDDDDETKSI